MTAQDVAKIENKIKEYEGKIHQHQREIEKTELLLRSIDVDTILKEDYEVYSSDQMSFFSDRLVHVEAEIKKVQGKLDNFESDFFESL